MTYPVLPAAELECTAQTVQSAEPSVAENLPAAHSLQAADPVVPLYVPAAQAEQASGDPAKDFAKASIIVSFYKYIVQNQLLIRSIE